MFFFMGGKQVYIMVEPIFTGVLPNKERKIVIQI